VLFVSRLKFWKPDSRSCGMNVLKVGEGGDSGDTGEQGDLGDLVSLSPFSPGSCFIWISSME